MRAFVIFQTAAVLFAAVAAAQPYDHLRCYKVKDPHKFDAFVDLAPSQTALFPLLSACKVKVRSKQFCSPVEVEVLSSEDPVPGLVGQDLDDSYYCYKMKCPTDVTPPDVEVTDPFGTRAAGRLKLRTLCAPAITGAPSPSTTTTTTTTSTTTTTTLLGPRIVFVSSSVHDGDFGGPGAADTICDDLADTAGLPGRFRAWLSNDSNSPSSRFDPSDEAYDRTDGVRVADNYDDLVDGTLAAPIDVDENMVDIGIAGVWTYTAADGTPSAAGFSCQGWSSNGGDAGTFGSNQATDSTFTEFSTATCSTEFHLYCVQQ